VCLFLSFLLGDMSFAVDSFPPDIHYSMLTSHCKIQVCLLAVMTRGTDSVELALHKFSLTTGTAVDSLSSL